MLSTLVFCKNLLITCFLIEKDKLLDKHITEDSFGEEQLQNIGRPAKSLVVRYNLLRVVKHIIASSCVTAYKLTRLFSFSINTQVVVCWACLLIVGAIKLFQSSALLSSWKGITVSATLLAVITILMQILINFTQSERSTPAKVAPAKRQNGKKVVENGQRKDEWVNHCTMVSPGLPDSNIMVPSSPIDANFFK